MKTRQKERKRYDVKAATNTRAAFLELSPVIRAPYDFYHQMLERYSPSKAVLELGAGTGVHSHSLGGAEAYVPIDVSRQSLKQLSIDAKREGLKFYPVQASIDDLPIRSESIDLIVSAGSLSYAPHRRTRSEILRVLKRGGSLIVVDSLRSNLIYDVNRFYHVLNGRRSIRTLVWMPSRRFIRDLSKGFQFSEIRYYGSLMWVWPLLSFFIRPETFLRLQRRIDNTRLGQVFAFKFVGVFVGKN